MKTSSEFGTGCVYNLGLFLAHQNALFEMREHEMFAEIWFNGASDHFYELQIPEQFPKKLRDRLQKLAAKSLEWGHLMYGKDKQATLEDVKWALQEAKDILRDIDKFLKVKSIKGEWE